VAGHETTHSRPSRPALGRLGRRRTASSEGVEKPQDANGGFQVFRADSRVDDAQFDHLNPQTQERVLRMHGKPGQHGHRRGGRGSAKQASVAATASDRPAARGTRHLAPKRLK
jgi:hypothetical protein